MDPIDRTQRPLEDVAEQPSPERTTLLVVDDEPFNVDILRIELEDRGFRVQVAENGLEALELLEEEGPADLALLDVMMPAMDGFELTRRLRADERTREMPIILLTAKGELGDKSEGFAGGADDYVVKPFDIEDVLARIETQLRIAWHLRRLRVAEEAQSKVAMVGAAAHELAQPLSGACGYLQLLQTSLELGRSEDAAVRSRLEQIRVCLDKTRQLADKMERLERVELEDYACGLHIVNIHSSGPRVEPPAGEGPPAVLVADLLGGGERALGGDLRRQGFRVLTESDLEQDPPPAVDLLLLLAPDREDAVAGPFARLMAALSATSAVPPPAMAVLPAPVREGPAGVKLLALGLSDVLARPFQLEELLLRMRSRIRLHRLRLKRIDSVRLMAALDVSQRALERMRPALSRGEDLLAGLEPRSPDLSSRLSELSGHLDTLTAAIRDLQARRLDRLEGERP